MDSKLISVTSKTLLFPQYAVVFENTANWLKLFLGASRYFPVVSMDSTMNSMTICSRFLQMHITALNKIVSFVSKQA